MPLGRVFATFIVDHRFAVTTRKIIPIRLEGREAWLTVWRTISPLEYVDLGNSMLPLDEKKLSGFKLQRPISFGDEASLRSYAAPITVVSARVSNANADNWSDEDKEKIPRGHRLSLYRKPGSTDYVTISSRHGSEIMIRYEQSTEKDEWQRLKDMDPFGARVYDQFVATYSSKTKDVRPAFFSNQQRVCVTYQTFVPYRESDLSLNLNERLALPFKLEDLDNGFETKCSVTAPIDPTDQFTFPLSEIPQITAAIEGFLKGGRELPMSRQILNQAQRALDLSVTPSTAVVEALIAVEVAVGEVVRAAKEARGVSRTKLKKFERDIGIGYMLNVELVEALHPISESEREVVGRVDRLRDIRNKVVHKGYKPMSEEAKSGLDAARDLLDMLSRRSYFV